MKTLVLIDIQRDYFPGGKMELTNPIQASLNARKLLDEFRALGYPIIHVRHISRREDASFFAPNTEGIEFDSNVKPLDGETVITKHYPNSFRETELKEELDKIGNNQIVFGGMMSHMCVDATVRAAADFGYDCTVAHDACTTRNLNFLNDVIPSDKVHSSFMAALSGSYASVIHTEEVLKGLQD